MCVLPLVISLHYPGGCCFSVYNFYICCSLDYPCIIILICMYMYNFYCGIYILSSVDSQCTKNTPRISVSVSQAHDITHLISVSEALLVDCSFSVHHYY